MESVPCDDHTEKKLSNNYKKDLMLPTSQATRATKLGTLSVPLNAIYSRNTPLAYPKGGKIPTIRRHAPAKSLRPI